MEAANSNPVPDKLLIAAIVRGNLTVVQVMLEHGAIVNVDGTSCRQLINIALRVKTYNIHIIRALVEAGADWRLSGTLMLALKRKQFDAVEVLQMQK